MALISGGGGGGSSAVLTATKTLTSTEIHSLSGASIQVVAAPGAGKILLPLYAVGLYQAGATPYPGSATGMDIGPATPPSTTVYSMVDNTEIGDIFARATNQVFFLGSDTGIVKTAFVAGSGAWDVTSEFENLPLAVSLRNGIGATGNGTCKLWIAYTVADLT